MIQSDEGLYYSAGRWYIGSTFATGQFKSKQYLDKNASGFDFRVIFKSIKTGLKHGEELIYFVSTPGKKTIRENKYYNMGVLVRDILIEPVTEEDKMFMYLKHGGPWLKQK